MRKDLRYGFRMLLKSPGFTLMAVLALALGIGANTAIFSVVNAVMLQKMPFENPDRLVMVWEQSPRTSRTNVANPVNFLEWQARNHSFERIAALVPFPVSLAGDGEPEQVNAMIVSDGFFQILGVKPIAGRWFTPEEDTRGKDNVVLPGEGRAPPPAAPNPTIIAPKTRENSQSAPVGGVIPASSRFPFTK